MYNYGARMYMPDLCRWGVIDPLAEKFFDFTGYNYVLNNPIKFVDKDGIRIKAKGLVGQLRFYRDGNKDDQYQAYHQSIKEYTSQVEDDMFNLFHYTANNAKNVEFSLIDFNLEKKRYLALQTYNDSGFSPGSGQIGKDVSTNAEYHNHPFKTKYEEDYTELNSMGSRGNGVYYGPGGDYRNTVDYNVNYPNYVFFPKSTNLYNVTKTGVYLIKKINNDSKNFKK
ncbi:RHS repeat-associated core domain-containing protein [Chryseobacterium vaccae]|uniref:RHS repeat-associated core domain-containing protein n=1 Tax=Chryseobacterium vaccae TaxID=2604424 RepID=UPI001297BAC6|nr:RHS repeat-associated core domain-containing protein [Chryseobacterium vaccae]